MVGRIDPRRRTRIGSAQRRSRITTRQIARAKPPLRKVQRPIRPRRIVTAKVRRERATRSTFRKPIIRQRLNKSDFEVRKVRRVVLRRGGSRPKVVRKTVRKVARKAPKSNLSSPFFTQAFSAVAVAGRKTRRAVDAEIEDFNIRTGRKGTDIEFPSTDEFQDFFR